MTTKPRKTAGNQTRAFGKTMGFKAPNSDTQTYMTQLNTSHTCGKCGMSLEWFNQCKNGEVVGIALECPQHGITR